MATEEIHDSQHSPAEETIDISLSSRKRKSSLPELEVNLSLPEPPSKRVKRAIKKGKPLRSNKKSDDEPSDDELPIKSDKIFNKERSNYGVWIGNLPYDLTRLELFKWLVDNSGGAITEDLITRVNMPVNKNPNPRNRPAPNAKASPANKGFAYVDFATFEAGVAATALSETELGGRKLLIKNSKSFEGRPKKDTLEGKRETNGESDKGTSKASDSGAARKIFVGNLSFSVDDNDIWSHFSPCGEIDWVKVATFEDTGKCKGYGWVKFKEAAAAEWAVKGFVKIKEPVDTEEDFTGENDDDDANQSRPKTKTRKWWVNMLKGRTLKIQIAEDDQTRYKKRFGKDAPAKRANSRQDGGDHEPESSAVAADSSASGALELQYQEDVNVARLTGGVVASQGKRTVLA